MKLIYKVFICGSLLISACTPKATTVPTVEFHKYEALQLKCDSLENSLLAAKDSIHVLDSIVKQQEIRIENAQHDYDEILGQNINMHDTLTQMNFKFLRIKGYCDIVKRDNTQLKYLRSWIIRVLED